MRFTTQTGLALLALAARAAAQNSDPELITCYGVNGEEYADNVKCPNSDTCCNAAATCTPQRLCQNEGQEENMFVRGPCVHDPYDEDKCGSICIVEEGFEGFIFPRVELCEDGSYCCSNVGNCCARGRGVFLDDSGNIVARSASSSTESSTSTSTSTSEESTTSTTAASTTTSDEASATGSATESGASAGASETGAGSGESNEGENGNEESDSGSDGLGLKVGLGVGIPVAAIIGGLIAWFCFKRRSQGANGAAAAQNTAHSAPPSTMAPGASPAFTAATAATSAASPHPHYQQTHYDPSKVNGQYQQAWSPEQQYQQKPFDNHHGAYASQGASPVGAAQGPAHEMDTRPGFVYEMDGAQQGQQGPYR